MLEINNVSKKFYKFNNKKKKEEFFADKNISFNVNDGEILGILGPNGAGKTTLLRMIAGIMKPSEGSITYDGLAFNKDDIKIKKNISFLSGSTNIYKAFSAYELLKFCADIYKVDEKTATSRINNLIKRLDMNDFIHNRIERLSTGQTQRVNIARCLVHDPKYYILDEATSGLDIISSQIILDFIKEERKNGKTILYSTHYMEEAENICDRVILIDKGQIIKTGSPEEIKQITKTDNLRDAFFSLLRRDVNEE